MRFNTTGKPAAIQAAGSADRAVCYSCNEPGHYANKCPHRTARVKQLEVELAALQTGEDFPSSEEEDVHLPEEDGLIEDSIGGAIGLRAIDIAPHLFEEAGPSDDGGNSHSLRLQSIRMEALPPSSVEGGDTKDDLRTSSH